MVSAATSAALAAQRRSRSRSRFHLSGPRPEHRAECRQASLAAQASSSGVWV